MQLGRVVEKSNDMEVVVNNLLNHPGCLGSGKVGFRKSSRRVLKA